MKLKPELSLNFYRTKNGFIVKGKQFDEDLVHSFNFDEGDVVENFADVLRIIEELYGPSSGRYDSKRIRVKVEPGDKTDSLTPEELSIAEEILDRLENTVDKETIAMLEFEKYTKTLLNYKLQEYQKELSKKLEQARKDSALEEIKEHVEFSKKFLKENGYEV